MGQDGSIKLEMTQINLFIVELQCLQELRIYMPNRNSHKGPLGQWPWHCSSIEQDGSIEFEMVQIVPAVVE